MNNPKNTDEYISDLPAETQKIMKQLRALIKKIIPKADEVISYGIPAFKMNGKAVIFFAAFKNHIGLYPAPRSNEAFKKELSAYKGGKGTVQFPLDKPLPIGLITRIVKFKAAENLLKFKSGKK